MNNPKILVRAWGWKVEVFWGLRSSMAWHGPERLSTGEWDWCWRRMQVVAGPWRR